MATTAQYTAQPIINYVQISTANTNRDGTGTLGTLITGPSTAAANGVGERINRIIIQATSTTTDGAVRFYLSLDGGTTKRLVADKDVTAITAAFSTSPFRTEVPELVGLILPGGGNAVIYVSTEKAETFNIICESGRL
jgi:hypothetical protein